METLLLPVQEVAVPEMVQASVVLALFFRSVMVLDVPVPGAVATLK